MSYLSQATLVDDLDLRRRIIACAAITGVGEAEFWAHQNRWRFAVQPGWEDAYATALEQDIASPGSDPDVITDAMILTAVQVLGGEDVLTTDD